MADSPGQEFADTEKLTDGFNLVIDALKLKMIKQEKKENFKNKTIVVSLFFGLGVLGYFISI